MRMTNQDYGKLVNERSKPSPMGRNMVWAFLVGGLICITGLGVFDKLAKRAGAGTLVPITGFANAMVSPALEFKSEGLITGTATKLFTVAGPVLVFGISASVIYGLILCLLK